MPAPANDNFASAQVISGASGHVDGNTLSATMETGEPGHYNYNRGPLYPTARTLVGPWNSVWYQWTAPANGYVYFSTRDRSGALRTTFPSSVQVFTGTAVNGLTRIAPVMDQSAGDGNGTDNGASLAINAAAGTVYYIQVDTRINGTTGNFRLSWGNYVSTRIGECTNCGPDFNPGEICMGSVQITDVTRDGFFNFGSFAAAAGKWQVRYCGGAFQVVTYALSGGVITIPPTVVSSVYSAYAGIVYTGPAGVIWDFQTNYSPGDCALITSHLWASANVDPAHTMWRCVAPTHPNDPGSQPGLWTTPYPGTNGTMNLFNPSAATTQDYGQYANLNLIPAGLNPGVNQTEVVPMAWEYNPATYGYSTTTLYHATGSGTKVLAYSPEATQYNDWVDASIPVTDNTTYSTAEQAAEANFCARSALFNNTAGVIGIGFATARLSAYTDSSANYMTKMSLYQNGAANPSCLLLYYPCTIDMFNGAQGFALTGSGTNWSITFNVSNTSAITWDVIEITLLTGGGIGSPSAAQSVTIPNGTTAGVGPFTFTADPTAGLCTATIQLSRNGVVIGAIAYPLYPIYTAMAAIRYNEVDCAPPKMWRYAFNFTCIWPPSGTNWWQWGATAFPTYNQGVADGGTSYHVTRIMLSAVGGGVNFFYGDCTPVTSVALDQTTDFSGGANIGVQAGAAPFTFTAQFAIGFQTASGVTFNLPTLSVPVTVPAA